MKTKEILKYCLALFLNIVPFFLACFLYEGGAAILFMFPFFQILINTVNYKVTKKITPFIILNLGMMISTVSSIEIMINLYYNNVSSDSETLAVGQFAVWVAVIFITLMTLISIGFPIVYKKSNQ